MNTQQYPVTTISLADQEVSTQANLTGEFSEIIDIQVPHGMKYEFPSGHPITMFIPTHEGQDGLAGSTITTVNLSNNLVNSPSVRDVPTGNDHTTAIDGQYSVVVWDDSNGNQIGVDAVDYDANSVDINNSNAGSIDVEIFYLWADPSQLEFRSLPASEESHAKEHIKTVREFHEAEVYRQPEAITFPSSFVLREKEHLQIQVKTDVDLTDWDAQPGDGTSATPGSSETYGYADFEIPVRRIPT